MTNHFYITDSLFRPKWWEKVILFFRPIKIAVDMGAGRFKTCIIFYKRWRGKTYVIREEFK